MKRHDLNDLQAWFAAQCNGEWEHGHGIKIETLDNPGWYVEADLHGTRVEGRRFEEVESSRCEQDWVRCRIENNQFQGFGGILNLEELIGIFLKWTSK